MSGHSKWSTIKRQKGVADVRRGQQFTRLANAITIAAREGGGNPEANFKLRLAVEAARKANMPKDNITRAVDRGTGKIQTGTLEEKTYEAYGPSGVALMIETVSDKHQRTLAALKSLIERSGGSMGGVGSVAWMFKPMGEIEVSCGKTGAEEIILAAADLGAEDAEEVGESILIYTQPSKLEEIKKSLSLRGFEITRAQLTQRQTNSVRIEDENKAKLIVSLLEKLENLDDVQKVYANFDFPEAMLQEMAV